MQKMGYTINGIREKCYHTDPNSVCRRHHQHFFNNDAITVGDYFVDIPVLGKPDILTDIPTTGSYKITHDGLYAFNCTACAGEGFVKNYNMVDVKCPQCSGFGWDADNSFDSMEELTVGLKREAGRETGSLGDSVKPEVNVFYQLGDLARFEGTVKTIRNLSTQYGPTVMVAIDTGSSNVVFFTRKKWVNKLTPGDNVTVKGFVKNHGQHEGHPQTVIKNPTLITP